jgi:hypothetical protein
MQTPSNSLRPHIGRLRGLSPARVKGPSVSAHPIQRDGLHHWRRFLIAKHPLIEK